MATETCTCGHTHNAKGKRRPTSPLKVDPSRTVTLRRLFRNELIRRLTILRREVRELIVTEDAFGIRRPMTLTPSGKRVTVRNRRFAFTSTPEQVAAFRAWLEERYGRTVLQSAGGEEYWEEFVREGYLKGQGRAWAQLQQLPAAAEAAAVGGAAMTQAEFVRQAFSQPVAVDKVKLLTSRVFTELKGVSDATAQRMTRDLAEGLARGDNPHTIARTMQDGIDSIAKNRLTTIARTEVIRAHAEGQLDGMERLGVKEVSPLIEWSTAGDDRVCFRCQPMDGTVMTIKEARGLIPLHPNCRCAWVPFVPEESGSKGKRVNFTNPKTGKVEVKHIKQKRTAKQVEKARDKSIAAEIPKKQRGKRTLEEQKKRSTWKGADVKIAKKRPASLLDEIMEEIGAEG